MATLETLAESMPMFAQHEFPTFREIEQAARRNLPPDVWNFLEGGAGDEVTLRENREAFNRWNFRTKVMQGVLNADTSTTVLGKRLSVPILTAPFGLDGLFHPDGHVAVARANARMGAMSVVPIAGTHSMEEVASVTLPKLFQFHPIGPRDEVISIMRRAESLGYDGFCVTLDCPVGGWRERLMRDGFAPPAALASGSLRVSPDEPAFALVERIFPSGARPWTWEELASVCKETTLPFLFKGVLTGADATTAVETGASAVLVSNHGGRQLDGAPAALDQLEEVVAAVGGKADIILDSGVRRGSDIAKALALGATAVLIGRPAAMGIAAAGEDGAYRVLELLRDELQTVMALLGAHSLADLNPSFLQRTGH